MSAFKGMSAFPITPADAEGRVMADELRPLLARLKSAKVNSVGLLGSTGTYMYLTRAERLRAVKIASDTLGSDIPLIVGIGALRTSDVVGLAQDAENAGANGLLLAPVSYTPLNENEVLRHFETVAEETSLPIAIYNNPGTTHFSFSAELLARLSELPNVEAVKMPLPTSGTIADDYQILRKNLPNDFLIGYSGDWGCADALLNGAQTWYSVIGGMLPKATMNLANAAYRKDTQETRKLDAQLQPLWTLFQEFGSLRIVYAIAQHLSLTSAALPLPLLPIPHDAHERVVDALGQLNTLD